MNFKKHLVSERKMLTDALFHVASILSERIKRNEEYKQLNATITSFGVEVFVSSEENERRNILLIRYDERNGFYYFEEKKRYGRHIMKSRIPIEGKRQFLVYFDHHVLKELPHLAS